MTDVLYSARGLTKRFGGLAAVSNVSVDLWQNRIHAVIGPNGAGKSTLTNLLSGDLPPTAGQLMLGAQDVTGWTAEAMSQAGLGRSFQKTNIFLPFTVFENVRLAAQSRSPLRPWNPLSWWQDTRSTLENRTATTHSIANNDHLTGAIELSGLQNKRHTIASSLSHGEQRQLEIAMTLATQPKVLLLDEPLAGMGVAEAQAMVDLLLILKKNHAILLVEHDMDAVFALADHLTVMVNGEVIASNTPSAVRADAAVQAAYLGEEHA